MPAQARPRLAMIKKDDLTVVLEYSGRKVMYDSYPIPPTDAARPIPDDFYYHDCWGPEITDIIVSASSGGESVSLRECFFEPIYTGVNFTYKEGINQEELLTSDDIASRYYPDSYCITIGNLREKGGLLMALYGVGNYREFNEYWESDQRDYENVPWMELEKKAWRRGLEFYRRMKNKSVDPEPRLDEQEIKKIVESSLREKENEFSVPQKERLTEAEMKIFLNQTFRETSLPFDRPRK